MTDIRPFKRILLKLSGEALAGEKGTGIEPAVLKDVAYEIASLVEAGVQTAVVVGGGNIFRGLRADEMGVDRVVGDHMGMIATVINSLALGQALESIGCRSKVMSAVPIGGVADPYVRERALAALDDGTVLIPAAGTGNPYFTTDSAAALRALELRAEVLFKATKVDGVYDSDPAVNPNARFFSRLSYREVIARNLKVMDLTAISLAMEHGLPVLVFNMKRRGSVCAAARGEQVGTLITGENP
jgi:uridylate kinase